MNKLPTYHPHLILLHRKVKRKIIQFASEKQRRTREDSSVENQR
jgi:hypothetical protein